MSDEPEEPKMTSIRLRTTPTAFNNAVSLLSDEQKEAVRSFGFEALLDFNIATLPHMLCYFIVEKFDVSSMEIKLGGGVIKVDRQAVHDVFGIPMGETPISALNVADHIEFINGWLSQYQVPVKEEVENPDTETSSKPAKKTGKKRGPKASKNVVPSVRPTAIANKIAENMGQVNQYFKMNFLMLFITSVIYSDHSGAADMDTLYRVSNDADFRTLDWCSYVLQFFGKCKGWKPNKSQKHYHGPATLLTLLYLDRTDFSEMTVPRTRPVFKNWSRFLLAREMREVQVGSFGTMGLRPSYNAFDDISYKLMEMSNTKKELFEAFHKQKQIDPENPSFKFYYSKFEEVCSMRALFYDGKSPNEFFDDVQNKKSEVEPILVNQVDNLVVEPNVVVSKAVNEVHSQVVCNVTEPNVIDIGSTEARKIVDDLVCPQSGEASGIAYNSNKIKKLNVKRKHRVTDEAAGSGVHKKKQNTEQLVTETQGEFQNVVTGMNKVVCNVADVVVPQLNNEVDIGLDVSNLVDSGSAVPKEVVHTSEKKKKERMVTHQAEVENETAKDGDDVFLSDLVVKKGRGRPPKAKEDAGVDLQETKQKAAGGALHKRKEKAAAVEVPPRKRSERITKRKISVNVVTKDGKGLDPEKPVIMK